MLPYLTLFGRTVSTYSLFAVVGLLAAVFYYKRLARVPRQEAADVDLAFAWGLLGTFVGAKLLSLLTQLPSLIRDWPYLTEQPALFLDKYVYAGFVFYGGLYGALAATWLYARHARISFGVVLRPLLPAIPLLHAFGRIGCFFAGCCYGHPTDGPLGVVFHRSEVAPNGVPLLPVQLFEAVGVFLLFAVLAILARRGVHSQVLLIVYLLCYGLLRFCLEFFRGDAYRGSLWGLSTSQYFSLFSVAFALILLWRYRRGGAACKKTIPRDEAV